MGLGLGFAAAGLFMLIEGAVSLALLEDEDEAPHLSLGPGPGEAGLALHLGW